MAKNDFFAKLNVKIQNLSNTERMGYGLVLFGIFFIIIGLILL